MTVDADSFVNNYFSPRSVEDGKDWKGRTQNICENINSGAIGNCDFRAPEINRLHALTCMNMASA